MRNTTIRKTGSAILAMVIGISSMVSPITADAATAPRTPTTCQTCTYSIIRSVFAPMA